MGRLIWGVVLTGWGPYIISANSGNSPMATEGDLYFGFVILAVGIFLIVTGISRIRAQDKSRAKAAAHRELRQHPLLLRKALPRPQRPAPQARSESRKLLSSVSW